MQFKKITSNLYKYNDNNTYLISINKKNNNGEQIKINEYVKANNDEDAINYLQKIYKDYNLIGKKKAEPKSQLVDKYIYKYGKDHYRLIIKKSKLFPNRIDEYHNLPLKDVKEIRDNYIAKARLNKLERKGLDNKYKNWTLEQFVPEYLEKYCKNKLSEMTVYWYERVLELYILPRFGKYELSNLETNVSELQEYINDLKNFKKKIWKKGKLIEGGETISTRTQNAIYGVLKGILSKAVAFRAIDNNPMEYIDQPKVYNKKTEFFTLEEMYNVLDLLKKEKIKIRFMFTLIICSGIRRGELVGLHIDDLDFENNIIHIKREVVAAKKYGGIIEKEPKTKNGIRDIPVPAFCLEIAKKYLEERTQKVKRLKDLYGNELVIPNNIFLSRFGKIMYPSTPDIAWEKFKTKHNLKHVTIHGLRHSWCTAEMHENNLLTDVEIAKLMGHGKNLNMTKHYTQAVDSKISKSSAIFSDYEENLKTDKGKSFYFTYEELITILSNKPYTNLENIKSIIERYYEMSEEVKVYEIDARLYKIKEELISYDKYFQNIENYLLDEVNSDWKILTEGKEKFGKEFKVSKNKIEEIRQQEKIIKI